jgi:hypothetical protein
MIIMRLTAVRLRGVCAWGQNMYFLTSLIMVAGFLFVVCLSLVKLTWELLQVSIHESPAILETPCQPAGAEAPPAKATESQ